MKNRTEKTYSVDKLMLNVASTLLRDFQANANDPCFCCDFQAALRSGSIAGIRASVPRPNECMDIAEFKAVYQLESVMKRYRFRKDTYSDQELIEKAINGFRETQDRLANLDLDSLCVQSQVVLDVAARYIAETLGKYDDDECRDRARFGRKASVGVPAKDACEAAKWEIPISGSPEQISWFDSEMSQIECVRDYMTAQSVCDPSRSFYQETNSLRLTLVPKTFKSMRSIMPNTTIGSYLSYGLGEMMRIRLQSGGYDIRTLQERHRKLAREASVHGLHVTADLSSASDSISVALVKRLFPADWFEILNSTRLSTVVLPDDSEVQSLTFCTMGIGYTFPLQTLVFLALLKAVEAVFVSKSCFDHKIISVYGDDMIYHSRMHSHVISLFGQLGFVINIDKTYHVGHFRESCGGDFFHGVGVRPFQPRSGPASVGRLAYEAVLYKYVNGLLARWSEYEIGMTLNFLMSEITALVRKVKIVPGDFPDDSGVKCPTLGCYSFLAAGVCAQPEFIGHGVYRFSFLRFQPDKRKETRHGPYLWLGLRGGAGFTDSYSDRRHQSNPVLPTLRIIEENVGITGYVSALITEADKPKEMFRSKLRNIRLRRTSTYVTVSHTGRYTRQSGLSCFEDRR